MLSIDGGALLLVFYWRSGYHPGVIQMIRRRLQVVHSMAYEEVVYLRKRSHLALRGHGTLQELYADATALLQLTCCSFLIKGTSPPGWFPVSLPYSSTPADQNGYNTVRGW